jgi:hypothetical protein
MKKQWIISVLLCGLAVFGYAQNFEDEFNAFLNQNQQQFNRFADSINKQFAEAMEANMRAFNGEQPKVRDPKPKPVKVPEAPQPKPAPLPELDPLMPDRPGKPEPERPTLPDIRLPEPVKPTQPAPSVEQLNMMGFNLFGEKVQVLKEPFPDRLSGIAPKNVSDFWIRLSECDYQGMLQACREAQERAAFNDWATYQMALGFAQITYEDRYNEQAVMTVFLLNQLGIDAKVGFDDQHLFCLLAVDQQLYGVSYAKIASRQYYIFETDPSYSSEKGRPFRTYDMPFPKQTHALDMHIRRPLKDVPVEDLDNTIQFNRNMIDLFRTYPQVDIEVYANATPSKEFCASVDRVLKPHTEKLSPYAAVDLLLTYVQYGFEYATDDEQFGYEKPFFCEESYYYPKNDCEDRSVLFSFLVRRLTGLDVVLIDYPGHIATAVHFPTDVKGESVMYNGKRYVICDPTYIGASIGMEMPDFTPADRTVVPL